MPVINSNISALTAQSALAANSRSQSISMQQLSTGLRINSSKDDAAGMAIAAKMTSQIRGLDQAVRNANDGISLLQTADGSLTAVNDMLQRMREISVQAASDTNIVSDRAALNNEFSQLRSEINRVAANTQWNGMNILDKSVTNNTGVLNFQVGANTGQTIATTIGNYRTSGTAATTVALDTTTPGSGPGLGTTPQVSTITFANTAAIGDVISVSVGDKSFVYKATAADISDVVAETIRVGLGAVTGLTVAGGNSGVRGGSVLTFTSAGTTNGTLTFSMSKGAGGLLSGIGASDITTQANANSAIGAVDSALAQVSSGRSEIGATVNRLAYAADNLINVSTNAAASRSRVQDTDFAKASTALARSQIVAQAATAMLAQANQSQQTVLALLR